MSKINDGGSAFPRTSESNLTGMSLRDWFAGQALHSISPGPFNAEVCAKRAYEMADAMLQQREQSNG